MKEFAENIRQYPFVRLLIPLLIGIGWQMCMPFAFNVSAVVISLFVIISFLHFSRIVNNYRLRWIWGTALFLLLFFTACRLVQIQKTQSNIPENTELTLTGVITDNPQTREKSIKINFLVQSYLDSTQQWQPVNESIIIYLLPDSASNSFKAGDKLLINTSIKPIASPQNPDEFDYSRHMARQGIFSTAFAHSKRVVKMSSDNLSFYKQAPLQLQRFIVSCFRQAGLSGNELAVATALISGDKQYIDKELKQSYISAGVIHLLAVSGLHVGILFLAFNFVLSFLNRKRYGRIIKGITILIGLWIYAAVANFSPSVSRAALMFSFVLIGEIGDKQRNIYNNLAASAFVLCVINPYCITDLGFQLSYLAVLGIVYFQPKIYNLIYFSQWLPDKLWSAASITLAAQIAVTPIVLYNFHQFPVYFLLANMVLIAFTTFVIYLAVALLFLSWIPLIAEPIGYILGKLLWLLNHIVTNIEALPCSLIDGIYINTAQCVMLMGAILVFAFYRYYRNAQLLITALVLLIAIFGINLQRVYQLNRQQILTVYNTPNTPFITFINGHQGILLCDSVPVSNYFDYQTKNNLIKQGFTSARNLDSYALSDSLPCAYHQFIGLGNKTAVVITNQNLPKAPIKKPFDVDYLLVSRYTKPQPKQVLACFTPHCVIIDPSTPVWKAKQWMTATDTQHTDCYWVKEQGAFIRNKNLTKKEF